MRRLMLAFTLLVLLTACTSNNTKDESNQGCLYNGAIVELSYHSEIPFNEIKEIWSENDWKLANPEADGHTIVGMISGDFSGNKWKAISSYKTKGMTTISVWVNLESEKNNHEKQVTQGNFYLDKVQSSLDKKYPIKDERTSKINWGCVQD